MTQLSIIPPLDPDRLVAEAKTAHNPVGTVCLFSGGNDSAVLAHRCRHLYERLVFIDTGTAIPGVREFVESFAVWLEVALEVYESGTAFRRMVLGRNGKPPLGMPGPGQHNRTYNQLKERQLEALCRDVKCGVRGGKVLMLTGIRRDESQRRRFRAPHTTKGAMAFCNPLIDWTGDDVRAYRAEYRLPQSDVAALIHRSGECNCGAYAAPGEREMLRALWPDWFERSIGALERECEARGIPSCRWGEGFGVAPDDVGALCSDCQLRLEIA